MLKQIVSLVLLAVAVASAADLRPGVDREDIPDVGYFKCTPTTPELNDHPWDCTRFIHCDNGRAHDKSCAACGTVAQCQGSSHLHFQRDINNTACIWPVDSSCKSQPPITTTTEGSVTTPGPACQANCTVEENDCRSYKYCQRTSNNPDNDDGTWVTVDCEEGYFFNPRESDNVGTCTIWEELDEDVQAEYNKQDKCDFCTITPDPPTDNCTDNYIVTINGVSTTKTCKAPRQFDKRVNGCVHKCVK